MTNKYDNMLEFAESINKPITNVNICKSMAALGQIFNPTSILDVNAGMGEILYYCNYGKIIDAYSTDSDNIVLGMDVNNRINFINESFLSRNIDKGYDLIISQIPFSYGLRPGEKRAEFIDLVYMEKILKSLNQDGVFVGLLPGRFAFEDYSLEMRSFIMENYSLEILVELPYDKYKIKNHNINIIVIRNKPQSDQVLITNYKENIEEIIDKYMTGKGEEFIDKALLADKWNKHYHRSKFNLLNLYKPSSFLLLGQVAQFIQGALFGKNSIEESGELIIINKDNIFNGRVVATTNDKYSSYDSKSQKNYILQDGDILVNLAMNGTCNLARYRDLDPCGIIQASHVIIRSENQYFQEFMNTLSGLSFFEDYLNRHLIPTNNRISISDIRKFKIPRFDSEDLILIEKKYNNKLREDDILARLNNIKREIQYKKDKKQESKKLIDELENKINASNLDREKLTQKLLEEKENSKNYEGENKRLEDTIALLEKMFKDELSQIKVRLDTGFNSLEESAKNSNESLDRVEEIVVRVEDSVNKYGRLIEDIKSMVTDLKQIQEDILEKLNKINNEDEKETIYKELTDEILKLIDKNYDIKRSHNIDKLEKKYRHKFTEAGWNRLNKDTKKHLITAQVIYDDLRDLEELDFSPVCIALTKALEIELFIHLFDKMQNYFRKSKDRPMAQLPDGILFNSSYQRSQYFSLGKVPHVLCLKFNDSYRKPISAKAKEDKIKSLNEFLDKALFKEKAFKNDIERDTYIKILGENIESITKKYRNPAAHRDSLTITDAQNCHNLILGKNIKSISQESSNPAAHKDSPTIKDAQNYGDLIDDVEKILIDFINKLA